MPAKRKQQPEEAVAKAAAKKAAKVADKIKDTVAENSPSTCAVNARL